MSRRLVVVGDSVLFTLGLQAVLGGLLTLLWESLGWLTMPVWLVLGIWLARTLQRRGADGRTTGMQRVMARVVAFAGIALGLLFGDTTPAEGGQFIILLIVLGFFAAFTVFVALVYDIIASKRDRAAQAAPDSASPTP